MLDFSKVKASERDEARKLFAGSQGSNLLSQVSSHTAGLTFILTNYVVTYYSPQSASGQYSKEHITFHTACNKIF